MSDWLESRCAVNLRSDQCCRKKKDRKPSTHICLPSGRASTVRQACRDGSLDIVVQTKLKKTDETVNMQ